MHRLLYKHCIKYTLAACFVTQVSVTFSLIAHLPFLVMIISVVRLWNLVHRSRCNN